MAVRPLVVAPDPRLTTSSANCEVIDLGSIEIAQDLLDTMRSIPGCKSLSAPQIGVPLRMIAIAPNVEAYGSEGRFDATAYIVVNPVITARDGNRVSNERCSSLPGVETNLDRATRIFLRGASIEGAELGAEVTGDEAILIQHCVDHLDGRLITD